MTIQVKENVQVRASKEFIYFESSNFRDNGYNGAEFRRSKETVELPAPSDWEWSRTISLPSRLEVITADGWQEHAVVFPHYSKIIYYMADGRQSDSKILDSQFYQEARRLGLTKGRVGTDKPIRDWPRD